MIRTQFITELEFEHVKEVYVEQAFLQYTLTDNVNLTCWFNVSSNGNCK